MPTYPVIGGAAGFLRRDLHVTVWCACGVGFERDSRDAAEQAHREHVAEMRNPDEHEEVAF